MISAQQIPEAVRVLVVTHQGHPKFIYPVRTTRRLQVLFMQHHRQQGFTLPRFITRRLKDRITQLRSTTHRECITLQTITLRQQDRITQLQTITLRGIIMLLQLVSIPRLPIALQAITRRQSGRGTPRLTITRRHSTPRLTITRQVETIPRLPMGRRRHIRLRNTSLRILVGGIPLLSITLLLVM